MRVLALMLDVTKLSPMLFHPAHFYASLSEAGAFQLPAFLSASDILFRDARPKPQALYAGSDADRQDSSLRKHFLLNRLLHPAAAHLLELADHGRLGRLEVLDGHLVVAVGRGLREVVATQVQSHLLEAVVEAALGQAREQPLLHSAQHTDQTLFIYVFIYLFKETRRIIYVYVMLFYV